MQPIYTIFISYRSGDHYCAAHQTIDGIKAAIAQYIEDVETTLEQECPTFTEWDNSEDYQDIYLTFSDTSWATVSKTKLFPAENESAINEQNGLNLHEDPIAAGIITEGLIACIADATIDALDMWLPDDAPKKCPTANSIKSAIEFPKAKIEKSFLKWILKHNLSKELEDCIAAHFPWAIAILEKYQQAWGESFCPIFVEAGSFPFLAPALGMGVSVWDDINPEDFGIEKSNQYPDVGLHELDSNAIYDLTSAMIATKFRATK